MFFMITFTMIRYGGNILRDSDANTLVNHLWNLVYSLRMLRKSYPNKIPNPASVIHVS